MFLSGELVIDGENSKMKRIDSILFLLLVLASSCRDEALFNSGDVITKTLELPEYSVIEVESMFEIELVSDTLNKVLITCGENLYPYVKITTLDNVLHLKHDIKNNWSRKYEKVKLKLHTNSLLIINVRKPCKIFNNDIYKGNTLMIIDWNKYCDLNLNINLEYFHIEMSTDNFGQYSIKGKTQRVFILGRGSCFIKADNLISENCSVLHRGIGDIYVNVSNQLDVALESSGNVYYMGEPAHINVQHRLGTGNIYKK